MRASERCGARTRRGTLCQSPALRGKRRCRMHGGVVRGSGAPAGNRNALKHGLTTREALERERALQALLRDAEETLKSY